jgi:hypothetical protein
VIIFRRSEVRQQNRHVCFLSATWRILLLHTELLPLQWYHWIGNLIQCSPWSFPSGGHFSELHNSQSRLPTTVLRVGFINIQGLDSRTSVYLSAACAMVSALAILEGLLFEEAVDERT